MTTKSFRKDKLHILVLENRNDLGAEAARQVSKKLRELLQVKPTINVIFAAAPSQNEFLVTLVKDTSIKWDQINAFHMDEYIGLPKHAPQLFSQFLQERLFGKVPFLSVNYINGHTDDVTAESNRYTQLLQANPPDIVCMGIGENAHIAFNDPPVADFNDTQMVKLVELDQDCRKQQVNDGCFDALDDVPTKALTLTIPAIMQAEYIYCMVPGSRKAGAVFHTLNTPLTTKYPATILRTHDNATLFLDEESFDNA